MNITFIISIKFAAIISAGQLHKTRHKILLTEELLHENCVNNIAQEMTRLLHKEYQYCTDCI